MRMPRVRFTVRGLMVAVAITGLVTAGASAARRCLRLRRVAAGHREKSKIHDMLVPNHLAQARLFEADFERWARLARTGRVPPRRLTKWDRDGTPEAQAELSASNARSSRGQARRSRSRFEFHRAMAEKYERAARYPWLPVAPDPPEPE